MGNEQTGGREGLRPVKGEDEMAGKENGYGLTEG